MSKQFSLNTVDFGNALKNAIIFGLPLLMSNLPQVQNYLVGLGIGPELCSFLLSTAIKLLQYWIQGDKKQLQ